NAHQWSYIVEQYTDSGCTTLQNTKSLNFLFAKATVYADAGLSVPQTTFGAGATAYVRLEGLQVNKTDYSATWILPSSSTACANTLGGDRPDSNANGQLPKPG